MSSQITVISVPPTPITVVAVGAGAQGVPGPPGPAGGRFYDHTQSVASCNWTVAHNLGRYPGVTVTDHLGAVITADVSYLDTNTLQITHATALTGCVYCN